jgi:hypothetical protein
MEEINKRKFNISDDDAMEIVDELKKATSARVQRATFFVPRTIVYPVGIEYQKGIVTRELRTFVRQWEYCSPAQWEEALELEKQYPKLNKAYTDSLKAKKVAINVKEPANPLNTTVIDPLNP